MQRAPVLLLTLLIVLIISACDQSKESGDNKEEFDFSDVNTLVLQEDMKGALLLLDSVSEKMFTEEQITKREKLFKRFKTRTEQFKHDTKDSVTIQIVDLFYTYWQRVLVDAGQVTIADSALKSNIADVLLTNKYPTGETPKDTILNRMYKYVNGFLKARGYYSNAMGKTGNLYDLFLWKKETEKIYDIELPESDQKVKVVFMDDFLATGWAYFATFGVSYAGGWAKSEAIYCVGGAYDLESESFLISYLTHEAQHYADYKVFPKLKQTDLEYRAKLTELSKSDKQVFDLLKKFEKRGKNDKTLIHPFANYCVVRDLTQSLFKKEKVDFEEWKSVTKEQINAASAELLKKHSEALRKIGANTVEDFIQ